MIVQDQSDVCAFLARAVGAETRETHISRLFLGPGRVCKLKRAVRLPYLDFSTPALRHAACLREVERNASAAPDLYLGVRRITASESGGLAWEGSGALVDAVVEMRRFEEAMLLDRLAARGALPPALMEPLAAAIADLHAAAPRAQEPGAANIAAVLAINEAALAEAEAFPAADIARFNRGFRDGLAGLAPLLDARARDGRVRLCHGDLHLGNIFLENGRPVLFDCIEFNDRIATIDVLYDLAYLLMDLRHRDLDQHANTVANRYLDITGDEAGMPTLPYFMALRAGVRAHVTGTRIAEGDRDAATRDLADEYFRLALRLLEPAPPVVVAIGGLSGAGKSTVAAALAPRLGGGAGARHLASDRIRKAQHGVAPETRLPESAYAATESRRVYDELTRRAALLASGGTAVVADAVFAREDERAQIAAAARAAGVPFLGVWLDLPAGRLAERLAARRGGPSDATPSVLERQLGYELGVMDWQRVDAGPPPDEVAEAILRLIRSRADIPYG